MIEPKDHIIKMAIELEEDLYDSTKNTLPTSHKPSALLSLERSATSNLSGVDQMVTTMNLIVFLFVILPSVVVFGSWVATAALRLESESVKPLQLLVFTPWILCTCYLASRQESNHEVIKELVNKGLLTWLSRLTTLSKAKPLLVSQRPGKDNVFKHAYTEIFQYTMPVRDLWLVFIYMYNIR